MDRSSDLGLALRDAGDQLVGGRTMLPARTTWAIACRFVGVGSDGEAAAAKGVLSHDGVRLRFVDRDGRMLVDEPMCTMAASIARGDLRCESGGNVLTFDEFEALPREAGVGRVDPSGAPIDVLAALHDAR